MIAATPEPPYYAVVFTAARTPVDEGYGEMAEAMRVLAEAQPGYLGMESASEDFEITVSYWSDLEAIKAWREQVDHLGAQRLGRERWYVAYAVRVAKVERAYGFNA